MNGDAPDLLLLAADIAQLEGEQEGVFLGYLPEKQAQSILRNRRREDQHRRLLARILVAFGVHLLAGESPRHTLGALENEAEGRPFLRGSRWEIGFSHSGRWAVCVIGDGRSTGPVGVDVEELRSLSVTDVHLVFSAEERSAIAAASDPSLELIRRWTIKEAVLKVRGTGFLEDPREVKTDFPGPEGMTCDCYWEQFLLEEGYPLTVAARFPWKNLRLLRPLKKEWRSLFSF